MSLSGEPRIDSINDLPLSSFSSSSTSINDFSVNFLSFSDATMESKLPLFLWASKELDPVGADGVGCPGWKLFWFWLNNYAGRGIGPGGGPVPLK